MCYKETRNADKYLGKGMHRKRTNSEPREAGTM
jgi:hypothetical protein